MGPRALIGADTRRAVGPKNVPVVARGVVPPLARTLTIGLAKELAAVGVRVNGVRPGIIETDIHASGGEPDRAALLGPSAPMGRAGRAEEVAEAIIWLLSDAASYATGTSIDISGGR